MKSIATFLFFWLFITVTAWSAFTTQIVQLKFLAFAALLLQLFGLLAWLAKLSDDK